LKLQTIGSEGTFSNGNRIIKLYAMTGFDHTDDMLLVYLPKEKILAEADAYTPPDTPATPLIAPKVPYARALYDNIRRLKLDVKVTVPISRRLNWRIKAEDDRLSDRAKRRLRPCDAVAQPGGFGQKIIALWEARRPAGGNPVLRNRFRIVAGHFQ